MEGLRFAVPHVLQILVADHRHEQQRPEADGEAPPAGPAIEAAIFFFLRAQECDTHAPEMSLCKLEAFVYRSKRSEVIVGKNTSSQGYGNRWIRQASERTSCQYRDRLSE